MRRTMDATRLNAVANMAQVRPWLGGEGALDLGPALADPRNFGLEGDAGGFVYMLLSPGRYEVHSLCDPAADGKAALEAAKASLAFMFLETDCLEVVTKVPAPNKGALGMVRACGFALRFTRGKAWEGEQAVSYYSLPLEKWMQNEACQQAGHEFHDWLEGEKTKAGSTLDAHADDSAHDSAAGCALLMAKAGNAHKGVVTYNLWAALAQYQDIALVSANPVTIDVRDAVVAVRGDCLEALMVRAG